MDTEGELTAKAQHCVLEGKFGDARVREAHPDAGPARKPSLRAIFAAETSRSFLRAQSATRMLARSPRADAMPGSHMLRLRAFGGLALHRDDVPVGGAAAQRKRLALLALIVTEGRPEISRDKVCRYLWPESNAEHARGALYQSVSILRAALGEDVLLSSPAGDLRVSPALFSSDVQDFERALAARDLESAVATCAGPFLDGIHLRDVPEFEEWVEGQRRRFDKACLDALETLATTAAPAAAAKYWRRRVDMDPLNSRVVMCLLQALVAIGERENAIRYARGHAALVRAELRVDPDPRIERFAAEVSAEVAAASVAHPSPPNAPAMPPAPAVTPLRRGATAARRGLALGAAILVLLGAGITGAAAAWPELSGRLTGRPVPGTPSATDTASAAYRDFQQANQLAHAEDWRQSWPRALEMYQRAISADSLLFPAHAALGVHHLRYYWWNWDRSPERLRRAYASIETASRLSPNAPEVLLAWGHYYFRGTRDYARALGYLLQAQEANPRDANTVLILGALQRRLGRYSDAIQNLQLAWELDPSRQFIGQTLAETLIGLRRFAEAEAVLLELIRREPSSSIYYRHRAFLHIFWTGDTARARDIIEEAERRLGRDARHLPHSRFLLQFYRGELAAAARSAERGDFAFDLAARQGDVYAVEADLTQALLYAYAGQDRRARDLLGIVRTKLRSAAPRRTGGEKHIYLAQVFAGLGIRDSALQEARLAEQSLQRTSDEWERGNNLEALVPVYVMTGEHDAAIERLRRLLAAEYYESLTVPELRLDPRWRALHARPGFQALVRER